MLGMVLIQLSVSGQSISSFEKIREYYENKKYEKVYEILKEEDQAGQEKIIFKALAFYQLSPRHEANKTKEDGYLKTLKILRSAKKAETRDQAVKKYLQKEMHQLQEEIIETAGKLYRNGRKNKSEEYFDALHITFDNSSSLWKNHYGFDDSYFLEVLKSRSRMNKEHKKYYKKEINKLLDRYYHSNSKYKEWNNPKYRLANTAKNENYLTEDEKMVYYFLNLVRMNPELFLETFIKTRLHIKYHGEIKITIPQYDTLALGNNYNKKLTRQEFYNLQVHNIYKNELSQKTEKKYISKKAYKTSETTTRYQYNINYSGLYNYLAANKPELLTLKNLSKFRYNDQGEPILIFSLNNYTFSFYNRTYQEETQNSFYYQSLFEKLKKMDPLDIIYPDYELFKLAECWAVEAGKKGLKGHERVNCDYGYNAESCDYGNKNGFDVILSLLVDKSVPDLGHRKILLGNYNTMGVAIRPHKLDFNYNAVLDFGL